MEKEELQHQRELLAIHQKNLHLLQVKAAQYGSLDVPLNIIHQIENETKEISQIENIIRSLEQRLDFAIKLPRSIDRSTSILIVDDDDKYRKYLCQLVETIGYETKEANTNQQARDFLFNSRMSFALVMTDALRRPERHGEGGYVGLDLVQIINSKIPGLPVILVSRDSPQSLRQRVPTLRVQAVVGKNLSDREIVTMIRRVLDGETLPNPWA